MTYKLLFFILFLMPVIISAQDSVVSATTGDEEEVKLVVKKLFDAMRDSDTMALKECFYDDVTMYTSYVDKNGKAQLASAEVDAFIQTIGRPNFVKYDEKLGAYELKIADNLASLAVDYMFFVGVEFSHCGVNFFQLTKLDEQWKIFFISDTRRYIDCGFTLESMTW